MNKELLEAAARSERMGHFYIFHGGSPRKRREFALHLAMILNCREMEKPCYRCPSCRKIQSGNHPDVFILEPLKVSLGIEQILAWQETVYRKNYEGEYKVSLIEQADSMTTPAANALLKVVEEPPGQTVIIISAHNAERLLPTVRSRAQLLYFPELGFGPTQAGEAEPEWEEALRLGGGMHALTEEMKRHGPAKVVEWIGKFRRAVADQDFVALFPLFPVENEEASLYLQALAVELEKEIIQESGSVPALLAVREALAALQQANSRLVIEVLALRLFQQGGKIGD
ncbi:MAG: DNA polymerase III subunit delta' [Desulfitobacteriaceae bacterium]